ncbi:hypothetical protein Tco_1124369 [Tanacetum coccineum]|uniref:Reverse transcriptase domain-containing protein n=1 Tax=Tanacetum coccineum TaxID=301880 RepID=A0ABQ5J6A3_9ASTR
MLDIIDVGPLSLDGYLDGLQFGVGVFGGSEAILHSVNRLIESCGDDVGLSILLVDFKNAFNLVDREVMLRKVRLPCPAISRWVLELIIEDGPGCGLHLNVDKTKVFLPKEDPRSRLAGIFPPNLLPRPLHGVKFLCVRRYELLPSMSSFLYGISRLYLTMCTSPLPGSFSLSNVLFDVAPSVLLLERIVMHMDHYLDDGQRGLPPYPFAFGACCLFCVALWNSQREDHTSNWLRVIPISGLGQTMNACSRVINGDIYGNHVVSCAGIVGIKHRHNVVRDNLVDICYRSGISAGKKVDIGLDGG